VAVSPLNVAQLDEGERRRIAALQPVLAVTSNAMHGPPPLRFKGHHAFCRQVIEAMHGPGDAVGYDRAAAGFDPQFVSRFGAPSVGVPPAVEARLDGLLAGQYLRRRIRAHYHQVNHGRVLRSSEDAVIVRGRTPCFLAMRRASKL